MNTRINRLSQLLHDATSSNFASALQAYGMMGWRVGYIAYPAAPGGGDGFLGAQLLKVQDTIPVCPPQLSQVQPSQAYSRLCTLIVALKRTLDVPCLALRCVRASVLPTAGTRVCLA